MERDNLRNFTSGPTSTMIYMLRTIDSIEWMTYQHKSVVVSITVYANNLI